VEVAITKLDWAKGRFTFSLKALLADPWDTASEKFPKDRCTWGRWQDLQLRRLRDAGTGVDGLLHISKLGVRSG
jgi:ribosomal protein S1